VLPSLLVLCSPSAGLLDDPLDLAEHCARAFPGSLPVATAVWGDVATWEGMEHLPQHDNDAPGAEEWELHKDDGKCRGKIEGSGITQLGPSGNEWQPLHDWSTILKWVLAPPPFPSP